MMHLTRHDYALALELLRSLEAEVLDPQAFAAACVRELAGYVACEVGACGVEYDTTPEGTHVLVMQLAGEPAIGIVLRRRAMPFSARERQRLELLRPHLQFLWRQASGNRVLAIETRPRPSPRDHCVDAGRLTHREAEVMRWLACGKTDADIAAFLAISPRTVHKHLEHIYEKLGVETRTAAVMRLRHMASDRPFADE